MVTPNALNLGSFSLYSVSNLYHNFEMQMYKLHNLLFLKYAYTYSSQKLTISSIYYLVYIFQYIYSRILMHEQLAHHNLFKEYFCHSCMRISRIWLTPSKKTYLTNLEIVCNSVKTYDILINKKFFKSFNKKIEFDFRCGSCM